MYRVKIIVLMSLLFWVGLSDSMAQMRTITVTVLKQEEGKTPQPQSMIRVHGFYDVAKAMSFMKKAKNIEYTLKEEDSDCWTTSDVEGNCELSLPPNGYVIAVPSFSQPAMAQVDKKTLRAKVVIKGEDEGIQMKTVESVAKAQRKNRPVVARRLGNRKILGPFEYLLYKDDTGSNKRTVLAPIATIVNVEDDTTGDTVFFSRPYVKDGEIYNETNERRMGYDLTHDPLVAFRSPYFMKDREMDSLRVYMELYPIDPKKHYRVNATHWYEDYNTVYKSDSVCLDEGYDKEPMRFLHYDLMEEPIDRERYKRVGRREMHNDHQKLDLKFVTGEARLDPNDSLSFAQLNQLKQTLGRYSTDESGISSATIHGYASPEGGIAINERLCRERASYLRNELSSIKALRGADLKVTATVASWGKVADLLESDSMKEEAAQVRAIVSLAKDTRVQEQRIKELPCYTYINEKVLPRLRIVDIEYFYYTNRVKTREEIWKQYQEDAEYRAGLKQQPYEFYQLFDMVKDNQEKEVLAKAALKSVKDEDYEKPWPLAAYELAQCYLARDTFDVKLLEPYLDWQRAGYNPPELHKRGIEGNYLGWVNDPAIVTTYVTMLCKSNDFYMADSVAVNLLPDEPKYKKLRLFLDCLNGLYNEQEVRDTVAASSPWNKIVVYAAQDDPDMDNKFFHKEALSMLQDPDVVDMNDPKVLYMTSLLRFRLEANQLLKEYKEEVFIKEETEDDLPPGFAATGYGGMDDDFDQPKKDWGYPLVQCCLRDKKYMEMALGDGYYNKPFRKAFRDYWKKLKENPQLVPAIEQYGKPAAEPSETENVTAEDVAPMEDVNTEE